MLGAGRMGLAMLEGWLLSGLDPARVVVCDPAPSARLEELAGQHGLRLNPPLDNLAPVVLVVAVKPQALADALSALPDNIAAAHPLVLSIAAGAPVALFTSILGEVPVVRAMPNTPAAIGKGMTGLYASETVSGAQRALARALLAVLGEVVEVPTEADIDKVTAISGSGPAYVFLLAECLAEAGAALGLDEHTAAQLARRTLIGAAALLEQAEEDPAALRRAVTSPGGTTEAALNVLMADDGGLCPLMRRATAAAEHRARELAGGGENS